MTQSDDGSPVRVAKDDLGAHVDQLVHEKKTALEHLLVDEDTSFGFGGNNEHDAEQVGRETGPRRIGNGEDGAVEERFDGIALLLRNMEIVASLLYGDP